LPRLFHMAGGALRLARFNTQLTSADKRYFSGPTQSAAAAILAGFIWICLEYNYPIEIFKYVCDSVNHQHWLANGE